jgi:hypothetical protein
MANRKHVRKESRHDTRKVGALLMALTGEEGLKGFYALLPKPFAS